MHTSTPPSAEVRLFDDLPVQYTGTLLHQAQARTTVLDREGHTVPVLCLDIELDCPFRNHMHVEQPFPTGHHAQAAAAAHRLKKGMQVTVDAPLLGLRLVATNVTHIHTFHAASDPAAPIQEKPAPCPQSPSP